jgi:quinoprotein glucose dehydrogenase
VKRLAPVLVALMAVGAASFDPKLPTFGARLATLPAGPGREIAARACLTCHSSDILRQQRLTEAQWAASVKKMIGWGAEVPAEKQDVLVKYLSSHFGPDNDRFQPTVTRPIGR